MTRRQVLKSLLTPDNGYIDGSHYSCILKPFAETQDLNLEERCWLAFLYGLCYAPTTAIVLFIQFPDPTEVNRKELQSFWRKFKSQLYFTPDKLRLKSNDQVVPAILSQCREIKQNPTTYWFNFLEVDFEGQYRYILKYWKFFGAMGAYLFFDAIACILPEHYSDMKRIRWKEAGSTVLQGVKHVLKDEELEDGESDLARYDKFVSWVSKKLNQPLLYVESELCAYIKLVKGTRYFGYYADRLQEEAYKMSPLLEEFGIDIWEYRKQTIPKKYLGELNGWKGIRKELLVPIELED